MTATITVRACTLAELRAASLDDLSWTPVVHSAGEHTGEPVRASELVALDEAACLAVRRTLPAQPGLYLWTTRAAGHEPAVDAGTEAETEAVIYLGVAAGRWGLADRLGRELRWVWNTSKHHAQHLQEWFHGHPRTMLEHDALAHYAVTEDAATARRLERELLAVTGIATGLTPLANGSAWHSGGSRRTEAQGALWRRAAAAGLLLDDESTP